MKGFKDFIKEAKMSRAEAHGVFAKFGVDSKNKSPNELKSHYTKLIIKHHPDKGGRLADAQSINSAWDTLKVPGNDNATPHSEPRRHQEPTRATPYWAYAGHSGGSQPNGNISKHNYTDMNFIKKDMAERSGNSTKEYTIHHFDGNFFRNSVTVYGNDKIHRNMAVASNMFNSNYRSKAVFVSTKDNPRRLKMIWANGRHLDHPIETEHESFNHNPGNDQYFTRNLSSWIDRKVS